MTIKIKWHKDAIEQLKKLDSLTSNRIVKKIKEIRLNPQRYVISLINMEISKIRIGNYRLFVDFFNENNTLIIHSIKHRKSAYKK